MQLLQTAFMLLLVGVLMAAVVSVTVMGMIQVRRTRRLEHEANSAALRFSADDPFDVPRRYADFALISNGHSPLASNVSYGRLRGRRVRAFDFRCEVGHGTRRLTKQYGVVVVEVELTLPGCLMWHELDAEQAPLSVFRGSARLDGWAVRGDMSAAERIGEAIGQRRRGDLSLQSCGQALMIFTPQRKGKAGLAGLMDQAVSIVDALDPLGGPEGDGGRPAKQARRQGQIDFGTAES